MLASTLLASALALGVLGGPVHLEKRKLVTDTQVVVHTVFKTKVDWVAAPSAPSVVSAEATHVAHHAHHHHKAPPAPQTTEAPQPTTEAPAPAPKPVKTKQQGSNPAPSAPAGMSEFQQAVLIAHNVHRANHSAQPLTWSASMAAIAQEEANVCVFAHNTAMGGGGYGQNIAAGVGPNNISQVITGMFYNGEVGAYAPYYGQPTPPMSIFDSIGHFTQVVWKGTQSVGCAVATCSDGGVGGTGGLPYFTVCNYSPPGNYEGEYGTNVGDSLGHPTVEWNYGGVS